ncbi:MAG: 30S ribosomal protein S6 [Candidatus Hydrogenedentes bacterium]|nr:30S ribosomal protein S6 [Candidatus Hydrogenedentota bacterium]
MKLRTYEALFIVSPEVEDDDIQAIARETESLIVKNGGAIVRSEVWGRRKLAYKIKKFTEGIYILIRFQAFPNFIARLEHYFRLSEHIIRHLIVYYDEKMLKLEAEQERRKKTLEASVQSPQDDEDNVVPIASPSNSVEEEESE